MPACRASSPMRMVTSILTFQFRGRSTVPWTTPARRQTSRSRRVTADPCPQPAGLDELEVRLAGLGLLTGGVTVRQAALPPPLRALHRRLLGAFLAEAGPPDLAVVA